MSYCDEDLSKILAAHEVICEILNGTPDEADEIPVLEGAEDALRQIVLNWYEMTPYSASAMLRMGILESGTAGRRTDKMDFKAAWRVREWLSSQANR